MAPRSIGFGTDWTEKEKTSGMPETVAEEDFRNVLASLNLEDDLARKQLAIDAKLRAAIVSLFTEFSEIRKMVDKHIALWGKYYGRRQTDPKAAVEILEELATLEDKFVGIYEKFRAEFDKYLIPNLSLQSDLIKQHKFTDGEAEHYQEVMHAIAHLMHTVSNPVMHSFHNRQIEDERRILDRFLNPDKE